MRRFITAILIAVILAGGALALAKPRKQKNRPQAEQPSQPLAAVVPAGPCGAVSPLPPDVVTLYQRQEWRPFLLKILPIVKQPEQLKKYNRYDLFMKKGETHLHLREAEMAATAFAQACQAAPDVDRAYKALGLAALTRQSRAFNYTPRSKGSKSQPIDIINSTETRPDAFKAYWADAQAIDLVKLREITGATTLPVLAKAITQATELCGVEYTVTKADTQSVAVLASLVRRAKSLMDDAVSANVDRVGCLTGVANSTIVEGGG